MSPYVIHQILMPSVIMLPRCCTLPPPLLMSLTGAVPHRTVSPPGLSCRCQAGSGDVFTSNVARRPLSWTRVAPDTAKTNQPPCDCWYLATDGGILNETLTRIGMFTDLSSFICLGEYMAKLCDFKHSHIDFSVLAGISTPIKIWILRFSMVTLLWE